jgi:predicted transposase/invertase (TIGR01784 family)
VIQRVLREEIVRESVIYQEILQRGIERGIEQGIEQVALNLLREGMEIEQVVRVTGLSAETVHRLRERETGNAG